MADYDYQIKLIVIGDSGVGKSSIILRYIDDRFSENLITTIGVDFKTRLETVQNKKLKIALWDTAGQDRYRTLTTTYYRGAHGAILVFDLTRKETFSNLSSWLDELKHTTTYEGIVKLLIGNKADLDNREVKFEEAEQLAKDRGMIYIETSAKTKLEIVDAFTKMANKIVDNPVLLDSAYIRPILQLTANPSSSSRPACGC